MKVHMRTLKLKEDIMSSKSTWEVSETFKTKDQTRSVAFKVIKYDEMSDSFFVKS